MDGRQGDSTNEDEPKNNANKLYCNASVNEPFDWMGDKLVAPTKMKQKIMGTNSSVMQVLSNLLIGWVTSWPHQPR